MNDQEQNTKELNIQQLDKADSNQTQNPESKSNEIKKSTISKEKKVIIHAAAYKSIILYSTRYANPAIARDQWKEIYGILIGIISNDAVIVEQAIPMTYGESTDVTLGPEHYGFIEEIQDRFDKEGRGRFMVGWFHSHPGLSLFYSYVDISNQIFFQSLNPDFIGIVFDHTYVFDKNLRPKSYEIHPSPLNPEYKITEDSPTHPFKTGIVCYRLNDPAMDINNPNFELNYHDVPYEIIGLDQTFFASLLTELSSYYTAGKPLEKAYKEEEIIRHAVETQQLNGLTSIGWEQKKGENTNNKELIKKPAISNRRATISNPQINSSTQQSAYSTDFNEQTQLSTIPINEVNELDLKRDEHIESSGDSLNPELKKLKSAEILITEGKTAFILDDSFTAIEKYSEGIKILEELGDKYNERILQTFADVAESCIKTNHFNLAIEFAQKLKEKAQKLNDNFQLGNGNYYLGYAYLEKNELDSALKYLKDAAIAYEKINDYCGMGRINELIGEIYEKYNNFESAILFYSESAKNYKNGIQKPFSKRTESWTLTKNLQLSIEKLKNKIKNLMSLVTNPKIHEQIKNIL